jgi:signal peptidase II
MDHPAKIPQSPGTPKPRRPIAGRSRGAVVLFILVVVVSAAADLGLKSYAFHNVAGQPVVLDISDAPYFGVPHHEPTVLIPGVLNLQLTANEGAIFGIGKGNRWIFVLVSIVAVGFVCRVFWLSDAKMKLFHTALALILAGAVGNLYDRYTFAAVRDMLHLFPNSDLPFGLTWPGGASGLYPWVFNLADVLLLAGVLTVVLITWRHAPPKPADRKAPG